MARDGNGNPLSGTKFDRGEVASALFYRRSSGYSRRSSRVAPHVVVRVPSHFAVFASRPARRGGSFCVLLSHFGVFASRLLVSAPRGALCCRLSHFGVFARLVSENWTRGDEQGTTRKVVGLFVGLLVWLASLCNSFRRPRSLRGPPSRVPPVLPRPREAQD